MRCYSERLPHPARVQRIKQATRRTKSRPNPVCSTYTISSVTLGARLERVIIEQGGSVLCYGEHSAAQWELRGAWWREFVRLDAEVDPHPVVDPRRPKPRFVLEVVDPARAGWVSTLRLEWIRNAV